MNKLRAVLLRQAAQTTQDPEVRARLATAADAVANLPDPHPLPGDEPLFDLPTGKLSGRRVR